MTESAVFDFAGLCAGVEDDLELLSEMIDLYLSSSPLLMTEIESAVASEMLTKSTGRLTLSRAC